MSPTKAAGALLAALSASLLASAAPFIDGKIDGLFVNNNCPEDMYIHYTDATNNVTQPILASTTASWIRAPYNQGDTVDAWAKLQMNTVNDFTEPMEFGYYWPYNSDTLTYYVSVYPGNPFESRGFSVEHSNPGADGPNIECPANFGLSCDGVGSDGVHPPPNFSMPPEDRTVITLCKP